MESPRYLEWLAARLETNYGEIWQGAGNRLREIAAEFCTAQAKLDAQNSAQTLHGVEIGGNIRYVRPDVAKHIKALEGRLRVVDEALNSGDGSYRP